MVGDEEYSEEMYKDEPVISLSEKIISVTHGYMTFKEGDVKKSVKNLKKDLNFGCGRGMSSGKVFCGDSHKTKDYKLLCLECVTKKKMLEKINEEFGNKLT